MNKLLLASAFSVALIGCSGEEDSSNSNELNDRYEGLYLNTSSAAFVGDDQGDVVLLNLVTNTAYVPMSFSQTKSSIRYDQSKEGHSGTWIANAESHDIQFSNSQLTSSQLGGDLVKSFSSGAIDVSWNIAPGNKFEFTASNGATYTGTLEWEEEGYWSLDDDFLFNDDSGALNRANAEIKLFVKDGVTYSIIYDKQFYRVIAIDSK